MKQSDIISIVLIAVVGVVVAFFCCNMLLGDPNEQKVTYQTVDVVTSELTEPNQEIFNVDAINPTVEVSVGDCKDVDGNGMIDSQEYAACQNRE